ncbi:MAG: aminotransferase class I/II-fold pyridoxal phosphate-dependent enzyme, partial [Gemmatimonadales bacterium]|nr:aminotransferase class I/II-fold pyridoxal phosphate-dependent enzyme [Gemmatimonadales bacterium]
MVDLCKSKNVVLANDAAYLEVSSPGVRPVSLLSMADPERDPVLEFHSLSKMFNMTGWRIAFAVGNPELIDDLARVKESIDSGVFTAVQRAAAYALGPAFPGLLEQVMAPYAGRRGKIVPVLESVGIEVFPSPATFYVWARVPGGESSIDFCGRALSEAGIVLTPGLGFGPGGEGWFRISLTARDEDIAEGARRLGEWL